MTGMQEDFLGTEERVQTGESVAAAGEINWTEDAAATEESVSTEATPRKEAWEYFTDQGKKPEPEKKKKNKVPGYICLVIGFIFLVAGVMTVLLGSNTGALETGEPTDVYFATQTDQFVYAPVQYMTEPVAYYEAMEAMQFYIVCDADWATYVVCLHNDELETWQPYIDWLYSDSYENEPPQSVITGYAQPFDEELEQLVIEGFAYAFGEGIVDESNFADYFGAYYLQTGSASGAFGISRTGIYMLLLAVILIVIGGAVLYEKPVPAEEQGPVVQPDKRALGVLGALLGALIGGLAWTAVGCLGYISGWIGILIVFFAYKGYSILSHKEDRFGRILSIVFSVIVIIPATYLSYSWIYYVNINETLTGYITLPRAMAELPVYMSAYDIWPDMIRDVGLGYVFMLFSCFYMFLASAGARKRKTGRKN